MSRARIAFLALAGFVLLVGCLIEVFLFLPEPCHMDEECSRVGVRVVAAVVSLSLAGFFAALSSGFRRG